MNTYSHLINLSNFLSKSNSHIAYTLKKLADYEKDHKARVHEQTKDRHMPFEDLFQGKDRIYEDFSAEIPETLDPDQEVADVLGYFGYVVTDYSKGLTTPTSSPNSSGTRIVKVLNKIMKTIGLKIISAKKENATLSARMSLSNEWFRIKSAVKQFNNSEIRSHNKILNSKFQIVYTRNIDDMAKMSTDRDWDSCFGLDNGAYKDQVIIEIMSGGIVAYLIKKEDLNIEKPLSRILIKRFKSEQSEEIKMAPENRVYGLDIEGFKRKVFEFAKRYNKNIEGQFSLMGITDFSDTFKDEFEIDVKKYIEDNIKLKEKINKNTKNPEEEVRMNSTLGIYYALKNMPFEQLFELAIKNDILSILPEDGLFNKNNPLPIPIDEIESFVMDIIFDKLKDKNLLIKNENKIVSYLKQNINNHYNNLRNTLYAIYLNAMQNQDVHKFKVMISSQEELMNKIHAKDIILSQDQLAREERFNYKRGMSYEEAIIMMNAVTQNKERTKELLEGYTPSEKEIKDANMLTGDSWKDKYIIYRINLNTAEQITAKHKDFNYILNAFSNNSDETFLIAMLFNAAKEIIKNPKREISNTNSINKNILKKIRTNESLVIRNLVRNLLKLIDNATLL